MSAQERTDPTDPTDPNEWADHLLWLATQLRDNDRDVEFVWLSQDGVAPSWTLADQLELAARNIRTSVPPALGATRNDRGRPERWNGSSWELEGTDE